MWCDIVYIYYKIIHVFGATVLQVPNLRVWHPWVSFWRCLPVSPDRGGQQNHMGKYCLHFHHAGQCADCVFMGNAIYEFLVRWTMVHPVPMKCFEMLWSFPVRKSSWGLPRLASPSMVPTDLWWRATLCGMFPPLEFTQKMATKCSIHWVPCLILSLACDLVKNMLGIFKCLLYLQACTRQQCHHLLLARKVLWSLGCTAEQCSRHLHAARLVWSIGSVEVWSRDIQGTLLQFMGK